MDMTISSAISWALNIACLITVGLVFNKAKNELKSHENSFVEYAPSLMTSLGLLGTFIGILYGLWNFDSTKIDDSIPSLLNGLETAFITSVIGMIGAIVFKYYQTAIFHKDTEQNVESDSSEVGPNDIWAILKQSQVELSTIAKGIGGNDERSLVGQIQLFRTDVLDFRSSISKQQELMESQLASLQSILKEQHAELGTISKGIGGNDERSLVGQIQLFRTDVLDFRSSISKRQELLESQLGSLHSILKEQHVELGTISKGIGGNDDRSLVGQIQLFRTDALDFRTNLTSRQMAFEEKLWRQMNEFAEMLSKSATEQVIEALKDVIIDFNQRLTDQFGDNFKRLDESVKKLVEWQANYKDQMETMTHLYAQGVESIGVTESAVISIKSETARIPADMAVLAEVLEVNQHQVSELERHLDAFVQMRDQAIKAVPQIQAQLQIVGQKLIEGSEQVMGTLIQGSEGFEESVKQTNQSMVDNAKLITSQSEAMSKQLQSALEQLASNTERIRTGITSAITSAIESVAESTQKILADSQQSVQSSIDQSQKARGEAIRVAEETGRTMTQNTDRAMKAIDLQIQEAVNRTNDAVNAQLRNLDEALSRQLNAALQELGSSLATIARHISDSFQQNSERR